MARDLEIGLLRSFVTAVRAGSISRAATAHPVPERHPIEDELDREHRHDGPECDESYVIDPSLQGSSPMTVES